MSPNRAARVDVFTAIGDPTRRRILELLAAGDLSVGLITVELGISQPSVSQHLAVLREVGLVEATRRGTSSIYHLPTDPLAPVKDWIGSLGR